MIFDTFRIYLTENCNANCPFCFNANTRTNKEMDIDLFEKMCQFLSNNGIVELKFMGGEPTVHSKFSECWYKAQCYFDYVSLFTNGLNKTELSKILLRSSDSVIYNYKFITNTDNDYLFNNGVKDASRRFEVLIQPEDNIDEICNKINKTNAIMIDNGFTNFRFNPTLDCSRNIFDDEYFKRINDSLYKLLTFCFDNQINIRIDHSYPLCCISGTNIDLLKRNNIDISFVCNGNTGCFGLVNSNFEIVHCNQYQKNKLKLFNDNGDIDLSIADIKKWLINQNQQKYNNLLETKCLDCKFLNLLCDGGCWGHKFDKRFENLPEYYI